MEQLLPVVVLILFSVLEWALTHRHKTIPSIVTASGIAIGFMLTPVLLPGRGEWLMATLPLSLLVF